MSGQFQPTLGLAHSPAQLQDCHQVSLLPVQVVRGPECPLSLLLLLVIDRNVYVLEALEGGADGDSQSLALLHLYRGLDGSLSIPAEGHGSLLVLSPVALPVHGGGQLLESGDGCDHAHLSFTLPPLVTHATSAL